LDELWLWRCAWCGLLSLEVVVGAVEGASVLLLLLRA
jgi:hypothetical protein